jgi:hypothetical protein
MKLKIALYFAALFAAGDALAQGTTRPTAQSNKSRALRPADPRAVRRAPTSPASRSPSPGRCVSRIGPM